MQATTQDIEYLKRLQKVDLEVSRSNKQLEELPQRATILEARSKLSSLASKQAQIAGLMKDVKKKLTRIEDEDASLAKKEKGVQAAIEAAGGDFRGVEARTKELDGIFKRRSTLAEEMASVKDELAKVEELEAQVDLAMGSTKKTEESAIASFQAEGGAIKNDLMKLQKERQDILSQLDPTISDAYMKTSAHVGSVTVGELQGNKCGTCRATIESGHLISLKNEAPLGVCPSCGRLLIIAQ